MANVLIDGNYIFHKTFGIFSGFGKKDPGDVLSTDGEKNMFMRKVITDLSYALNQIPEIDRIVFCRDSRSWRKDFEIERSNYKESRTKGEGVDWSSFFSLMDQFGKYLENNGHIYSVGKGAEGDDLLWIWAEKLINKEENVIVISGDKDMHQIVKDDNKNWIVVWNNISKNNKISVEKEWLPFKNEDMSIFDVNPLVESIDVKYQKLISSCEINIVDTREFIFKKILAGDKKDDVPGVYPYYTEGKNGKKLYNIGEGRAKKIWDIFKESKWKSLSIEEMWETDDFINWLAGVSLRTIKQTDDNDNREKFKQNYIENGTLVWLSHKTIPLDVIRETSEKIESELKKSETPEIRKKELIENSPWGTNSNNVPKEFDPFKLF
jgi:5'-3' exonuclease